MKLNRMINELRSWAEKLQEEAEANRWQQYNLAPDPLNGETRHSLTIMVKRTKEMLDKRNEDVEIEAITPWEANRELQIIKLMSDYLDARIEIVNRETGSNIKNTIKLPDPITINHTRKVWAAPADIVTTIEGNHRKIYKDGVELSLPLQELDLADVKAGKDEPRPAWLPKDVPWYGGETDEEPDPYIFDGHMSVEDHERLHELLRADKAMEITAAPVDQETIEKVINGSRQRLYDAMRCPSEEDLGAVQTMAAAAGVTMAEAAENLGKALELMARAFVNEVITPMADALKQIWDSTPDWMKELPPDDAAWLELVATPRQWHLMNHGRPRVRKKWRHALERKAKKLRKEAEKMANDYYKCPDCGAILDPGEKCDCKDQKHEGGENDGNTENTAGTDTGAHEGNAQQLPGRRD